MDQSQTHDSKSLLIIFVRSQHGTISQMDNGERIAAGRKHLFVNALMLVERGFDNSMAGNASGQYRHVWAN